MRVYLGSDHAGYELKAYLANQLSSQGYDVVVLACVGGTIQAMLHGLARAWHGARRRPVIVTGYVGVVYEKLTDGLLLRHGADMILANSRFDADAQRLRELLGNPAVSQERSRSPSG